MGQIWRREVRRQERHRDGTPSPLLLLLLQHSPFPPLSMIHLLMTMSSHLWNVESCCHSTRNGLHFEVLLVSLLVLLVRPRLVGSRLGPKTLHDLHRWACFSEPFVRDLGRGHWHRYPWPSSRVRVLYLQMMLVLVVHVLVVHVLVGEEPIVRLGHHHHPTGCIYHSTTSYSERLMRWMYHMMVLWVYLRVVHHHPWQQTPTLLSLRWYSSDGENHPMRAYPSR